MKTLKHLLLSRQIISLLCFMLILPGCQSDTRLEQTFYTFGTEITLVINHPDHATAQLAIHEIEQAFYQLNQKWHAWNPDSMLSEINRALAENRSYPLDLQSYRFIKKNQQYSQQSDYLFDPAIGGLIRLWGFQGQANPSPPSDEVRQKWLAQRPSIKDISFIDQQIKSHNTEVRLDFGGSAKGLAMDEAERILQHYLIRHALINIGGDIKVLGYNANKQAWSIGVQNPKNPAEAIARIKANNQDHIFTSGTYQRYFEWQGKTYSHIINPNTAWPADTLASVTVIHSDAILADIAATALMIAGPDDWQRIAHQLNVDRVMVVNQQGQIQLTPKMAKQVTLIPTN
ncbi:FAD:protein FMN transferase [Thiomicrospira microaerophila]|uniref:FAD:protein FMN transferase n=1 Tax=Thiomicrospira microaerophila TaxID=406020 RepID=UPI00200CC862|nr:FAD:protein FMN transferase [Thiomicrospira microaerophila]UQB41697.1 FAD:protein FMN transferase [Thiomicrospira microaerophila]